MAVREIIVAPDPRLKVKCDPVGRVDSQIKRLMDDLIETMHAAHGIGLAAPQIGVHRRVIAVDIAREGEKPNPLRMADPELVWVSDEDVSFEEGCLSVPEHYAQVVRPRAITVRFRDDADKVRELKAEGLLATCIQHEMEHLEGILFIDHLSALKRSMILRKLTKTKRAKALETA